MYGNPTYIERFKDRKEWDRGLGFQIHREIRKRSDALDVMRCLSEKGYTDKILSLVLILNLRKIPSLNSSR